MHLSVLDFATSVQRAGNLEEAWLALSRELKQVGLLSARYGFASAPKIDDMGNDVVLVGDFEDPVFSIEYERLGLAEADAAIAHCIISTKPISWNQMDSTVELSALTGKERIFYEMNMDHGLINGITIPLREANPYSRGGIGMKGDPYENAQQFETFIQEKLPTLRQMAEVFHCNLQRPLLVSDGGQLSQRERECLLWATYGLQTQQIADRIGSHPKTVEKQLSNARSRLKARTTTQAAIKAVLLGLIEP